MRLAVLAGLLVAGCANTDEAVCPAFSSAIIYEDAKTYATLSDNASQCEMYWLTRFNPLPGPASDAVEAVLAECRLVRELAYQQGVKDQRVTVSLAQYTSDSRGALLATAFERRMRNCAAPRK